VSFSNLDNCDPIDVVQGWWSDTIIPRSIDPRIEQDRVSVEKVKESRKDPKSRTFTLKGSRNKDGQKPLIHGRSKPERLHDQPDR
jgi:hypothetical protein